MAPRVNKETLEKYFNFINNQAVCKLCSHSLKRDRNFNLKTHLKKIHKIHDEEFLNGESQESDCSSVLKKKFRKHIMKIDARKQQKTKIKPEAPKQQNTKIKIEAPKQQNTKIKIEISKKQLFRSYIGLVTEDSIPFNILNSENFKNITDPICQGLSEKDKPIRLTNIKQALKMVADNIKDAIKTEVQQRLLSLKVDSGTRLLWHTFAISAQFIKNNEIQSRMLGMVELKSAGASSSRNLSTEILKTLNKYDINLSQIVSITSDNGANLIKTTNNLSHCSIFEDENDIHDDGDDRNEIYLKNIQMFEDSSDLQLGEIQICGCAANLAQLCALDVAKDAEIKTFLLSCRNLVKFIKKQSNDYKEMFELQGLEVPPQLDCPTRWGSTYKMVLSVKNAKDVLVKIESISNKSVDENFKLNDSFWHFVAAYCVSFEPLQRTIVKFQAEQLHYGDFYAEWLKCKICTEKVLEENDNKYVQKIATKLLHSMEVRKTKLLSNESLISCLYLDPRFHHTLTRAQRQNAANYLKKLYERIKSINIQIAEHNIEFPASSSETGQFASKADEYLHKYLIQNFTQTADKCIDVHSKIVNLQLPFLRADTNVLQFWRDKQYTDPELYALSNICFAVPPTQVTFERAFSALKLILADDRNGLNHETLENILLIKLNSSFLDKAIEDLPLFEDLDVD